MKSVVFRLSDSFNPGDPTSPTSRHGCKALAPHAHRATDHPPSRTARTPAPTTPSAEPATGGPEPMTAPTGRRAVLTSLACGRRRWRSRPAGRATRSSPVEQGPSTRSTRTSAAPVLRPARWPGCRHRPDTDRDTDPSPASDRRASERPDGLRRCVDKATRVSVALTGDVLIHTASGRPRSTTPRDVARPAGLPADVRRHQARIESADLAICHLETPLATAWAVPELPDLPAPRRCWTA